MFSNGFPKEWSTLRKLMWLRKVTAAGLPEGYKKVKGFKFSHGTYYKITDFFLKSDDVLHISFSVDNACNVFGCYTGASATNNYSLYAMTTSGGKYLRYDGSTYNSCFSSAELGKRFDVTISASGTSGMPIDSVFSESTFTCSSDLCIGTTSPSATSLKLDGNIWGNIVVEGRLKLVPCERLSDGVLGYYDMVGGTFYEPVGSAPTSLGDA